MLGSSVLSTAGAMIISTAISYAVPWVVKKIMEYKNDSKEPVKEDDPFLC